MGAGGSSQEGCINKHDNLKWEWEVREVNSAAPRPLQIENETIQIGPGKTEALLSCSLSKGVLL